MRDSDLLPALEALLEGSADAWDLFVTLVNPWLGALLLRPGFLGHLGDREQASRAIVASTRSALEANGLARVRACLEARANSADIPITGWLVVVALKVAVDQRQMEDAGGPGPAIARMGSGAAVTRVEREAGRLDGAASGEDARIGCIDAEILLATNACLNRSPWRSPSLPHHLQECDPCFRVSRKLENGVVAQALLEAASEMADLGELTFVPEEHYVRGQEIGRGGMGRVLRARDRRLGRWVAIKELLDDRSRKRFEQEARLTARLQHPSIVSLYEAGRWASGEPFYAMKYVEGKPLISLIRERETLSERLALLSSFISVAEAIAYAHSEHVLHRDIKPHNILIGAFGEAIVIDWGLAKELSASTQVAEAEPTTSPGDGALTAVGTVVGTPAYMAPEQASSEPIDERVDVFALGATLFHLLAGRPPSSRVLADPALRAQDGLSVSEALIGAEPHIPRALAAIVERAMSEAPEARYRTARELTDELKRFQNGQLVSAYRYSLRERLHAFVHRNRALVTLGAGSALLVSLLGAVSLSQLVASRRRAEHQIGELLVDKGREELARGGPARALPFFAAALERGLVTPSLPTLLSTAAVSLSNLRSAVSLPGGAITRARISPDGTRIVASGHELEARLWELPQGTLVATLKGDPSQVQDRFEFSPSGETLVTSADCLTRGEVVLSCREDLRVWDARTGALRFVLPNDAAVSFLRFVSARILLVSTVRHAEAWDVTTGTKLKSVPTLRGTAVAYDGQEIVVTQSTTKPTDLSPDATQLLELKASATALRLLRLPSRELVRTIVQREPVYHARFTSSGEAILTLSRSGTVRAWDTASGAELGAWDGHAREVLDARLVAHDQLVTVGSDNRVLTWHAASARLAELALSSPPDVLQFGPKDRLLVMQQSVLSIYDPSGKVLARREPASPAALPESWTAAAFDETGDRVFLGSLTGAVAVWSLDQNTVSIVSPQLIHPEIVRARSDRRFLDEAGRLLDVHGIAVAAFDGRLAYHDDDSIVTLSRSHDDPLIMIWRPDGPLERVIDPVHPLTSESVVPSPDKETLAVITSVDVKLLEASSGRQRHVLEREDVDRAAFGPSGDRLVTVTHAGDCTVWSVDSGTGVTLPGRAGSAMAVKWSPDGKRLLVGGDDGVTRLFDAEGLTALALVGSEQEPVSQVAWSQGGVLVAVSAGPRVSVWNVSLPSVVDTRELLLRDPHVLRGFTLAARSEGPASPRDERARAREHYLVAMERMTALDPEMAAKHCELAFENESWPGYAFCAAANYGAVGKAETAIKLLKRFARAPLAPDDATLSMRAHHSRGGDYYARRMFREAIVEFDVAYRHKPSPSLLYNIAMCHERLDDFDAAAKMFGRYLAESPGARDRMAVELRIATLEALRAGAAKK